MYIVITGTSRGIGLALTRLALSDDNNVLAIARNPEESDELMKLRHDYSKCEILKLDILEPDAPERILHAVASWPKVDVVINNAAIYEKDLSIADFEKTFLTNTIKPFFITKALFNKMKKSERPVTLQISSQMGSLEDNASGGSYSYRASKSALNMLYKSLSIDEKWLISLLVHPGWVQTRMGGSSAPLSVQESADGIWNLIRKASPSQSGIFVSYRGDSIPW